MATLTSNSILTAVVETIGRAKPSQFGGADFHPVLFQTPDGQKVWKSYTVGSSDLDQLQIGQTVTLLYRGLDKGKASYDVLIQDAPNPTPQPTVKPVAAAVPAGQKSGPGMSAEQKKEIAAYVEEMGGLYAFCLTTAQSKVGASADSETVRCMASSLFIGASRKFGL